MPSDYKGNNFCDFLFPSLADIHEALSNFGLLLKKRGDEFFQLRVKIFVRRETNIYSVPSL